MQMVKEKIRVGAIFGAGGNLRPVWFDWCNRKYTVKEITYAWLERRPTLTLCFAVSDGATLFQLAYDTFNQVWTLTAVEPD